MDSSGGVPWVRIVTPEWKAKRAREAFRCRILETLDMVAVMGDYMRLRRRGRDYCGACPFHHDRGESLWVRPDRGIFKCFECGIGGTLIRFFQRLQCSDEAAATAYLAVLAGLAERR